MIDVESVLRQISYPGGDFRWDSSRRLLSFGMVVRDVQSNAEARQWGRKWYVSEHSCLSEVVQTALKAVLTFVEHEVREVFRYDGCAVFNPHIDVEALREVSLDEDRREATKPTAERGSPTP